MLDLIYGFALPLDLLEAREGHQWVRVVAPTTHPHPHPEPEPASPHHLQTAHRLLLRKPRHCSSSNTPYAATVLLAPGQDRPHHFTGILSPSELIIFLRVILHSWLRRLRASQIHRALLCPPSSERIIAPQLSSSHCPLTPRYALLGLCVIAPNSLRPPTLCERPWRWLNAAIFG